MLAPHADDARPMLQLDGDNALRPPVEGGPKRKQSLKAGRNKCWFPECACTVGLARHPVDRTADVQLALRVQHHLDADTPYPSAECKLCPTHLPAIYPHQVLGAKVAVLVRDEMCVGIINDLGRGGLLVSDPSAPLMLDKPWRVDYFAVAPQGAPAFMSTEEVGQASTLAKALASSVKTAVDAGVAEKQRRIHALEQQVSSLRQKSARQIIPRLVDGPLQDDPPPLLLELELQLGPQRDPPTPPSPPDETPPRAATGGAPAAADTPPRPRTRASPRQPATDAAPPLTQQQVSVTARLPANHVPGSCFSFAVPPDYLPGSPRQVFRATPPADQDPQNEVG